MAALASLAIHALVLLPLVLLSGVRIDPGFTTSGEHIATQTVRASPPRLRVARSPGACASRDDHMAALVAYIRRTLSGPEPRARLAMKLPLVDSSQVRPVASDSLCDIAAATINRSRRLPATTPRTLYIVAVGNVYFVEDTTLRGGEYGQGYVMDSLLTGILGKVLR